MFQYVPIWDSPKWSQKNFSGWALRSWWGCLYIRGDMKLIIKTESTWSYHWLKKTSKHLTGFEVCEVSRSTVFLRNSSTGGCQMDNCCSFWTQQGITQEVVSPKNRSEGHWGHRKGMSSTSVIYRGSWIFHLPGFNLFRVSLIENLPLVWRDQAVFSRKRSSALIHLPFEN